jgi:hypothetical protein
MVLPVSDPVLNASETVTLTIPGQLRFVGIVRLFVGGLAARLDLGYEAMDDLQLALESVLRKAELGDEMTIEAHVEDEGLSILVGPLGRDPLDAGAPHPERLELERLLAALVADAESTRRDDRCWLRLDVRVAAGSGSA